MGSSKSATPSAPRQAKKRRYFQYRVVAVGGSMEGRIAEGDLTLDYWQGKRHTYSIFDLKKGEQTGWYEVVSEGECDDEQYAGLRERGRPC